MTLMELLQLIREKIWLVILLVVLGAAGAGIYTYGFLQDEYTTTVRLYVLVSSTASDKNYVSSSDTTASQQLANDISELAKSSSVENAVAASLGLGDLDAYKITVTNSSTTRMVSVAVTGKDPQMVAKVAESLAKKTDERAKEIMEVEAVNIVDDAEVATSPSGPHRLQIIGIAALAGLFVAIAIIVLLDMLNTTVGRREDIERMFDVPVLGSMPELKAGKR